MGSAAPIHFRAAGLVSALGEDWPTCCAAARAGLRRAEAIEDFENVSEVDGEEEAVAGHAAGLVTEGFEGSARLLRLLAAGLRDLLREAKGSSIDDSAGCYLAIGQPQRIQGAMALIADPDTARSRAKAAPAASLDEDGGPPPPAIETDPAALLAEAATLAGWPGQLHLRICVTQGDVSGLIALAQARADLQAGTIEQAVVLAADSLLPEPVLEWLQATGRLKCSDAPLGLEPGEACAALLLDAQPTADSSLGVLLGIEFAVEPKRQADGEASTGAGTAAVLSALARRHGWGQRGPAWLVSDMNGEAYRAADLATALVRARPGIPSIGAAAISYPALNFGDVGAARGLLGICTVLAGFQRGYAPAPQALVLAVGECHRRAATLLSAG